MEANLDIAWRCILYPVKIDEELVRIMAKAGCVEVSLGFESGHEPILHGMNKRFKPEDVRRTSELLASTAYAAWGSCCWVARVKRKNRLKRALHLRTL